MDYTIYRLNTDNTREVAGTMHGAPEDQTSHAFAVALTAWVGTYCRGDIGNCGYEAEPVATFDDVFPMIDFDKCARERIVKEWIAETDNAIKALQEWRSRLSWWHDHFDTRAGFDAAIQDLADAGLLLDWADRNPAGLDALADAVIIEEVAA